MSALFSKIGDRINKTPFKVLFLSILIFAILITGVVRVHMATGSETLVKNDNDAYISNYAMENHFGGDAIMILLEGQQDNLLDIDNMEKMWNVEQRLQYEEGIFTIMSPASVVHQITDRQGSEIKKQIPTISDGLGEMGDKLTEIGIELGNKELPDPGAVEEKLNDLMNTMDFGSIMEEISGEQEAQIKEKFLTMGHGLGEMGKKLMEIGTELNSKDLPDPKAMEEKLNNLTNMMSPDGLISKILGQQNAQMQAKIIEMSTGLEEMGNKLIQIGTELGSKDLPDPKAMEEKLNDLSGIAGKFHKLIDGQDNIGQGATELKRGLAQSSAGLGEIFAKLDRMADQLENNSKLQEQLNAISENIKNSSEGLMTMSEKTGMISEGSQATSNALSNISSQLQEEVAKMKEGLSGDGISADELKEMSNGFIIMGENLSKLSKGLSSISTGEGMLPDGSDALLGISSQLEQEIAEMKKGLSGGISPDELKTMSKGFITMGENLSQLSEGLLGMSKGNGLFPDGSDVLADISSKLEQEINEMRANLSGGISPDELKTMSEGFITMGENLGKLEEGLATFHDKSGMIVPDFPHNQAELDNILYEEDGSLREIFSDTILDDNHIMMMVKLEGNLDDNYIDSIYDDVSHAMEKEDFGDVNYIISGKPVLDSSLRREMKSNMIYMVASAVLLMFIILSLVFKVRWRVLSLGIIFVSVIATLGLMGHLNVSMTMVSMAVFPILIGLGIDYSIQFQNRYEEEKSVRTTLAQIGKAVALAVLATMLGFVSLYASPVPMIRDFGKMLTIGVVISFIGSIFLLMPILGARDLIGSKVKDVEVKDYDKLTAMDKALMATGKWVTKLAPLVLVISIGLAAFGFMADTKVGVETDIETFMPQDMDALHDIHYIRDIVGSTNQMVIFMEDDDLLTEGNILWMRDTVNKIEDKFSKQIVDVKSIDNLVDNISPIEDLSLSEYMDIINDDIPKAQRKMFINDAGDKAVILMNVEHMSTENLQGFVEDMIDTLKDAPINASITGKSVLDVEMVKGLTDGRVKMTIIGIGLVFVALLLLYRSFFRALVPVFPIILIVGMSGGVMNLLGLKYTPITATLGALVLGMGTEMTIMLLERYLEERNSGKAKAEAMSITIRNIGKATVASGLTTVGGFSVLMTSKFVILKDFGLMTVINISLALMSTFVILPALISLLDRFIVDKKVREGVSL